MLYSSPEFLCFFILAWTAFLLLRSAPVRGYLLLFMSVIFFSWSSFQHGILFLILGIGSWLTVWAAQRWPAHRAHLLRIGIGFLVLGFFGWRHLPLLWSQLPPTGSVLERASNGDYLVGLGIGIFVFQIMSYLIEYSRGTAGFISLKDYLLFGGFFPHLLGGPMSGPHQLLPQLNRLKGPHLSDLGYGLALFCLGFFKKVAIADRIAPFVDFVFFDPSAASRGTLIIALIGLAVQVWAVFSGLVDMGRGAACLLGIHLPNNFQSPLLARSPSEFWKRWNVTGFNWVQTYFPSASPSKAAGAFLPAGSLLMGMALIGLWHGVGWSFLIWGIFQAILLLLERSLVGNRMLVRKLNTWPTWLRTGVGLAGTQTALLLGWLILRCDSYATGRSFVRQLILGGGSFTECNSAIVGFVLCLILQTLTYLDFSTTQFSRAQKMSLHFEKLVDRTSHHRVWSISFGVLCGLALSLVFVGSLMMRRTGVYLNF